MKLTKREAEIKKAIIEKLTDLRRAEEKAGRFLSAIAYQGSETLVEIEFDKERAA